MARKITSATIDGETYNIGDTVHYIFHTRVLVPGIGYRYRTDYEVEGIIERIVAHKSGRFTFVMEDGTKVAEEFMQYNCEVF